jgi:drug/metabolite transporter (DMT)-like permease
MIRLTCTFITLLSISVQAFVPYKPTAISIPTHSSHHISDKIFSKNVGILQMDTGTATMEKKPLKKLMVDGNKQSINDETNNMDPDPNNDGILGAILWRGVVVVLCALWASNFAAAKLVMSEPQVDSSLYAVSRFTVAALSLLPGTISAVRRGAIDLETAKGAAICGAWVGFGYLGQTLGLLTTTASRSCVICTLHCVFVAAVAEFMRVSKSNAENESFNLMKLAPALVAVTGVAIVELQGAGGVPTIGDALSFAQPIGFGLGYIQLEELVKKSPNAGLPISFIKLFMVSIFSYAMFELSPLLNNEEFVLHAPDFTPILSSPLALGGILYTGLITTGLALWVESIAFKRVPATDASIILTTEPLFAALVGAITLGETFGASDYIGATLIIGACALAILLDNEKEKDAARSFPISTES